MQLTANLAVLATAVAYAAPSVFALPLNVASESNSLAAREYELETREVEDLELAARDLIEEYYQAREVYDELDARSFDDQEFEAREFLDYLDARDAPAAAASATPSGAAGTAKTSPSPAASPSPSATPATGAPPAGGDLSTGTHAGGHHGYAHMPRALIRALTDEHHHKLKHYAEIELHIFNTLIELTDGEPNHHGVKESPEVEALAKEILQLKKWHHHHSHKHGAHHHEHPHADGEKHDAKKDGEKPAHEKHDAAKDATAPTPASGSATPSTSGAPHHHGHHGHGLHHKIHELKIGSHKADRIIARAKIHRDRLYLISLGPASDHDEAYHVAIKHEKEWLERQHKKAAAHHHASSSDPSTPPSATSTSAGASPTASGADKAPKADKATEPAGPKTAQGVKRRALRRRAMY